MSPYDLDGDFMIDPDMPLRIIQQGSLDSEGMSDDPDRPRGHNVIYECTIEEC